MKKFLAIAVLFSVSSVMAAEPCNSTQTAALQVVADKDCGRTAKISICVTSGTGRAQTYSGSSWDCGGGRIRYFNDSHKKLKNIKGKLDSI